MIHRLRWRVASDDALGFWAERLAREGVEFHTGADERALAFGDPEGLDLELAIVDCGDEPLRCGPVVQRYWSCSTQSWGRPSGVRSNMFQSGSRVPTWRGSSPGSVGV